MGACFARVQHIAAQEKIITKQTEIIEDLYWTMYKIGEATKTRWEDITTAQYEMSQHLDETIVQLEEVNKTLTKENIHLKQLSEFLVKAGAK